MQDREEETESSVLSTVVILASNTILPIFPLDINRIMQFVYHVSFGFFHSMLFVRSIHIVAWTLFLHCSIALIVHIGHIIHVFIDIHRRRQWQPTPVLLPGKSHGRRSLVGCGPWGREESDMTERLHLHFSLSCIGEGNGNPLLCSCLENPRGGGAWWAVVYGVSQSWIRLK